MLILKRNFKNVFVYRVCLPLMLVFGVYPVWAVPDAFKPVLSRLIPGSVVFIGETHQNPESMELIRSLVDASLSARQCLTVALEIDDRQQPLIDGVRSGVSSVNDIKIPAAIDHPAFRQMINDLVELDKSSGCVSVVAIDTGIDTPFDRDDWMAKRLNDLPKDKPILVLVGALHSLKHIDYLVRRARSPAAEQVNEAGLAKVSTYIQRWLPETCSSHEGLRSPRFIPAEAPEALRILNSSVVSVVKAKLYSKAVGVVDGFIRWDCR
ncbi:hypothetical protein [Methylomonas sp. TEB]|uniref:hypothetical protein n=1 Tax=Methylomonas sp. TEB TaxID=3398229 RepID=UPI0039F47D2A